MGPRIGRQKEIRMDKVSVGLPVGKYKLPIEDTSGGKEPESNTGPAILSQPIKREVRYPMGYHRG